MRRAFTKLSCYKMRCIVTLMALVFVLGTAASTMSIPRSHVAGRSMVRKESREHPVAAVLPGAGGPVLETPWLNVQCKIHLLLFAFCQISTRHLAKGVPPHPRVILIFCSVFARCYLFVFFGVI